MLPRSSQPPTWHIPIHTFIPTGRNLIRLMPYPYAAAIPHAPVERNPGRHMIRISIMRISMQLLERPPILNQRHTSPGHHRLGMKKPRTFVRIQLADHRPHCPCHRHPLSKRQQTIDSHADQKHNERPLQLRRITASKYLRHRDLPKRQHAATNPCTLPVKKETPTNRQASR